ncbi:hypothetical protein [Legionella maioricensis]|uniref:PPM-type phosphatase domain-containing protein n=1 Tax=Legionella maioricensis TaxID=2896528 RepID=A0A9X2ICI5_9GAMM|nr:hypothetical protein [Legionella maioricensis]MCL9684472.1 hypothetical protein [Legionella maioricensis]MCL9688825.1 hypothetical protein [Legionella maioricensis]
MQYDGRGNLITATLADTVTFAVIYGKKGDALGVIRLNKVTHKGSNEPEKRRIEAAGGTILFDRVYKDRLTLGVSRAIGDQRFKDSGVCSEASIDVTNVKKIAEDLHIDPKDMAPCKSFLHAMVLLTEQVLPLRLKTDMKIIYLAYCKEWHRQALCRQRNYVKYWLSTQKQMALWIIFQLPSKR